MVFGLIGSVVGLFSSDNKSQVRQELHELIETNTSIQLNPVSKTNCDINTNIEFRGNVKNCTIQSIQTCTAYANVSAEMIKDTILSAEMNETTVQKMKGIALSGNESSSDQLTKQEIVNNIEAECEAKITTDAGQNHIEIFWGDVDCTGSQGNLLIDATQYGDARASCFMNTLVSNIVKANVEANKDQETEGLSLDFIGDIIGAMGWTIIFPIIFIGLLVLAAVFSGSGGNGHPRPYGPPPPPRRYWRWPRHGGARISPRGSD